MTGRPQGGQTLPVGNGAPNHGARADGGADAPALSKRDYERLAELRTELRRFARATELAARRIGVSPQQYLLLLALKGFPGRDHASISELAERLQVRHNAVIGLINRAESRRLVARLHGMQAQDRRVVLVRITDTGEQLLQRMAESLREERSSLRAALRALDASGEAAVPDRPS
jgi:DNA-binding MarR family transcriptional regulator